MRSLVEELGLDHEIEEADDGMTPAYDDDPALEGGQKTKLSDALQAAIIKKKTGESPQQESRTMRITKGQLRQIIREEFEMVSVEDHTEREDWADGEVVGYMKTDVISAVEALMNTAGGISKELEDRLETARSRVRGGERVTLGDLYMPLYRIVASRAGDDEVGRMITLLLLYGPNLDPTADYAKRHRAVRNP